MSFNFPPAFESRMQTYLQNDWDSFLASHQTEPVVSIRMNPAKMAEPENNKIPWTQFGQYLPDRPIFTLDPHFHAGAYYVQEASSMFLEQAIRQSVDLSQSLRVLDLCAAPGGKSTHLLSLINRDSLLVSNEAIRSRATILCENLQKWGAPNVIVTNNDPKDFQGLSGYFDLIVVDAPCSGEGLFRKDPDAMDEWSPEQVNLCAQRQRRILEEVWPSLKEHGILVYCTCTYSEAENEENLEWLSNQHGLTFLDLDIEPSWGIHRLSKNRVAGFRCYPHRVRGEGFFIAVARKTELASAAPSKTKSSFIVVPGKTSSQLKHWIADPDRFQFILQDELILMVPEYHIAAITWLSEKLRIINKGTALASIKHEKLIPDHASALSTSLQKDFFPQVHLTREQAISYLRKESQLPSGGQKGFALMVFDGLPLGWANLLENRVNNLYPAAWRIRMKP